MKILFISRRFYPEILGGGQISPLYIAKALANMGHKVRVCTFKDTPGDKEEVVEGIPISRLHMPKLKFLSKFSNVDYMYLNMAKLSSKIIRREKPDVLHLLNLESIPFSAYYYKKKFRLPITATVNGPLFGCFTGDAIDYRGDICMDCKVFKRFRCSVKKWGSLRGSLYYGYSHWYMRLYRFSYKYVDNFFVVSKAMQPFLINMGVPERKIKLIHNPVQINNKIKTSLKDKLGLKGKKVILYVGRLSKLKGVQYTLEAMSNIDNAVFLVIGEKRGDYSYFFKLSKNLNLKEKVKFIGFVQHEKIGQYYSIADLAVLLGEYYEPLSRFLLESCSYGLPIVARNIGGNSDIVEDGKNGILLDDCNPETVSKAILQILSDNRLYKKMSDNCIKKIKSQYLPEIIGKKLVLNYRQLVHT
ncbi:glycosyltransferase family 4 protein [Candidatus Woesearchaeota archaeon]|nr:glycosyltransferase family 4 protein [Candidatus Woesearchaeota archaeon]